MLNNRQNKKLYSTEIATQKWWKIPRTCNAYYIEQGHVIAIANFFYQNLLSLCGKKNFTFELGLPVKIINNFF